MENHSLAFVFPGQGSQKMGMMADMAAEYPQIRDTLMMAGDLIDVDLWAISQHGPDEKINQTAITQPLLLAASVGLYHAWSANSGVIPAWLAGHSLGEYSALVCAGALRLEDAVRVVRTRGELMQSAVPEGEGAMVAVIGLEDDQVIACCKAAAAGDIVAAVNFNAPGQVVIAGNGAAVERASQQCKSAGAKRCLPLPVSVPSHCALMRGAAEELAGVLADVEIRKPEIAVVHNVDASTESEPEQLRAKLVAQLYSPVQWVQSIRYLASKGVSQALECGPGKVLSGLIRRIDRNIDVDGLDDPARFPLLIEELDPH